LEGSEHKKVVGRRVAEEEKKTKGPRPIYLLSVTVNYRLNLL
jgi:hypothetical protein